MRSIYSSISLVTYLVVSSFIFLPVSAGGCNNHSNQKVKNECPKNDKKCLELQEKNLSNLEV